MNLFSECRVIYFGGRDVGQKFYVGEREALLA